MNREQVKKGTTAMDAVELGDFERIVSRVSGPNVAKIMISKGIQQFFYITNGAVESFGSS